MTENNPNVPPPGGENIPPPPPPPPPTDPLNYETPPTARPPETNPDARTMGMLTHLTALAGFIIPLRNIIGPLVVWLVKKDQYPFVDDQGKESLNFQITMLIAAVIAGAMICIVIGIALLPIVGIVDIIFVIIAMVKANKGEWYRYPFAIRLIK